jgi:hypothetical protein
MPLLLHFARRNAIFKNADYRRLAFLANFVFMLFFSEEAPGFPPSFCFLSQSPHHDWGYDQSRNYDHDDYGGKSGIIDDLKSLANACENETDLSAWDHSHTQVSVNHN